MATEEDAQSIHMQLKMRHFTGTNMEDMEVNTLTARILNSTTAAIVSIARILQRVSVMLIYAIVSSSERAVVPCPWMSSRLQDVSETGACSGEIKMHFILRHP